MTRTETGSVGLMFVALSPGRVLTCACGRGGALPPNGPVDPPEHAASNAATTSNINTRRMVPTESSQPLPAHRVSRASGAPVSRQRRFAELSVPPALYVVLHAACLPALRVLLAPSALWSAPTNEVQPDLLVARYADLIEACLPVAPVLVAEALSRSTQLNDRNTKKRSMSGWGCPRTGYSTRSSRVP